MLLAELWIPQGGQNKVYFFCHVFINDMKMQQDTVVKQRKVKKKIGSAANSRKIVFL